MIKTLPIVEFSTDAMMRVKEHEKLQERMKYIREHATKEELLQILQSAGIVTEDEQLADIYKQENKIEEEAILLEELAHYVEEVATELKDAPCTIFYDRSTHYVELEMARDHEPGIWGYKYIRSGTLDKNAVRKDIYEEVLEFLEEEISLYPEETDKYSSIISIAKKVLEE